MWEAKTVNRDDGDKVGVFEPLNSVCTSQLHLQTRRARF
jgi:hypothetical protein